MPIFFLFSFAFCLSSFHSYLYGLPRHPFCFSMGMVLISVSCTMSRTSVHSSAGTLSIRSSPLNLFSSCQRSWLSVASLKRSVPTLQLAQTGLSIPLALLFPSVLRGHYLFHMPLLPSIVALASHTSSLCYICVWMCVFLQDPSFSCETSDTSKGTLYPRSSCLQ